MAKKKYKVGVEVEAWCTKCKMDRLHVIETLKSDGNINRVMCRFCDGVHLFRRPKGEGGKGGSRSGGKRRKKSDGVVSEAEAATAKQYAVDGEFAVGDILSHSRFGVGRVTNVRPGGKMEVAFGDDTRVLLCRDVGGVLGGKRRPPRPAAVVPAAVKEATAGDGEEVEDEDAEDAGSEEE